MDTKYNLKGICIFKLYFPKFTIFVCWRLFLVNWDVFICVGSQPRCVDHLDKANFVYYFDLYRTNNTTINISISNTINCCKKYCNSKKKLKLKLTTIKLFPFSVNWYVKVIFNLFWPAPSFIIYQFHFHEDIVGSDFKLLRKKFNYFV